MADLRALLYEPWCQDCGPLGGQIYHPTHFRPSNKTDPETCTFVASPPLAERLPECVPPGLEWIPGGPTPGWLLSSLEHDEIWCLGEATAELLFIGQAVTVLAAAIDVDIVIGKDGDVAERLAAALHQLADERET